MRKIKKAVIFCTAAASAALLLVGAALTVAHAKDEKDQYVREAEEMARRDLCDAAEEMLRALIDGNAALLNRAAGKAEAYLSRAGFDDCGEVYREIKKICSGECGEEECARLVDAVKKALRGDNGEALREIAENETDVPIEEETTEDLMASRMLKRLGKSRDDVALRRAQAFACPNAEFEECQANNAFAYSGDNVFILVAGREPRVVLYCFDRDTDERYSITKAEAERNVELIIQKEKLRLGEHRTTEENGVLRTVCYGKNDLCATPLVTIEIYSDTGRLRLYDASDYYKYQT